MSSSSVAAAESSAHFAVSELLVACDGGGCPERGCHLNLRVPAVLEHVIGPDSPLHQLAVPLSSGEGAACGPGAALLDVEVMVLVEGTLHSTGAPCIKRRVYKGGDIRRGHRFVPIVSPPPRRAWGEPGVDFTRFHDTEPAAAPAAAPHAAPQSGEKHQ